MNIDDLIYAPIGTRPRYWIKGDVMYCEVCNTSDSLKAFMDVIDRVDPSSTLTCDKAPVGGCPILDYANKHRKGSTP